MSKTHSIRFFQLSEQKKIIDFISSHWAEDHIFTKHSGLLDWQHRSKKHYNFVGCFNQFNSVEGILGFIPFSHFLSDSEIKTNHICLAIWKVLENTSSKNVGISLLSFLKRELKPSSINSIGINCEVQKIYEAMGYRVSCLNQLFILNKEKSNFDLAKISNQEILKDTVDNQTIYKLKHIDEDQLLNLPFNFEEFSFFNKTKQYFLNRYGRHPIYEYKYQIILDNQETIAALLVTRIAKSSGVEITRIVDSIFFDKDKITSENLSEIFNEYLIKNNQEYIDVICDSSELEIYRSIGFKENTEENFVPNKLEPLIQENSRILYATTLERDIGFHRGDSDQDRPNLII